MAKSSLEGATLPAMIHAPSRLAASVWRIGLSGDRCHGRVQSMPAIGNRLLPLPAILADISPTRGHRIRERRHGGSNAGRP